MNERGIVFMVRVLAIDRRLRKLPYPSLDDLIEAVKEARDGISVGKRTVQLDIQIMRQHGGLRTYAPIVYCKRRKAYHYSDKEYSLVEALLNS